MTLTAYFECKTLSMLTLKCTSHGKCMVLFEFKHTEVFTSHGGYLLNTKLFKVFQQQV